MARSLDAAGEPRRIASGDPGGEAAVMRLLHEGAAADVGPEAQSTAHAEVPACDMP